MSSKSGYVISDSYKGYKKFSDNPAEKRDYLNVNFDFMQFIMNKLFEGHALKVPERMGVLEISGQKQKITIDENDNVTGLAPDWQKTFALWKRDPSAKEKKKLIYHLNEHTSGVRYKIYWSKARMLVDNKTAYILVFSRKNKRHLAKIIKEQHKEYRIR